MKAALAKTSVAVLLCLLGVLAFYLIFGKWPMSGLILLAVPVLVFARAIGPGEE